MSHEPNPETPCHRPLHPTGIPRSRGIHSMKTTSTYGAALLDVMGSDLTVVNAARVSFDKESEWEKLCPCGSTSSCYTSYCRMDDSLKTADAKLIAYLARNAHWTPFAHPQLSFRVSAPLFVARQLQKHQVGLAWNEVSRRYVDSEPVFYLPGSKGWRAKADNVKQGSSDEIVDHMNVCDEEDLMNSFIDTDWSKLDHEKLLACPDSHAEWIAYYSSYIYDRMLVAGVCPEQARMVLPQSMMTEWVWTGSLAAFARVCKQRLDPHAQRECRPVAEDIAKALREHFPVSYTALTQST